jgi:hypothetical protein
MTGKKKRTIHSPEFKAEALTSRESGSRCGSETTVITRIPDLWLA